MSVFFYAGVLILVWTTITLYRTGRREKHLPPGPPTLPVLGNLHMFPTNRPHFRFTEWSRVYGGVYSLKLLNSTHVIISSMNAVKQIMDTNSTETGDRPSVYILNYVTEGLHVGLAPLRSRIWKTGRKAMSLLFAPKAVNGYHPIVFAESSQLMFDILQDPEEFYAHIQRATFSVITSITYGCRCPRSDSWELTHFMDVLRSWMKVTSTEIPPLDLLPFLKYAPERWAPWKQLARDTRRLQCDIYFSMLSAAEKRMANNQHNGSFIEDVIQRQNDLGLSRDFIAHIGGSLLEGASDPPATFILSLVLAIIAYPEAQKKAQDEIDRVVGHERAPTFEDVPNLPYMQALMKEVHRFRPVAPLAVPHMNSTPIEYNGYVIPEGSVLYLNSWGILHDPDVFEQPEEFSPERYLLTRYGTKPGIDESDWRDTLAFGSGKRLCPGLGITNISLSLYVAHLLWAFDFEAPIDSATGKSLGVNLDDYCVGLSYTPKPFKAVIRPRHPGRSDLINKQYSACADVYRRYEGHFNEAEKRELDRLRSKPEL